MTDEDIKRIESELAIALPAIYRRTVVPFPIAALAGNADSELWDDPTRLVILNRELRVGDRWRKPWPDHLFAVGEMDGESYVAIDLRGPDAPTWWIDHGHIDAKGSGQTHDRFENWAGGYLDGLRADISGDGYDPDGTPQQLESTRRQESRQTLRGCALFVVVLLISIIIWLWWRSRQ